jgi:hypothetical protein
LSPLYFTMIWDIDLIFGMRMYNHKLQINFEIPLLFLAYYWGKTFASLLNIHGRDIRVVPTHLVFIIFRQWSNYEISFLN